MLKSCFTSPKLKGLQGLLQCGLAATVGHLELLWNFTGSHAPHGNIGKWSDAEIAGACDWSGEPGRFIFCLLESRFIDTHDEHRLVVHDWQRHCPRWVKAVVSKSPNQFATNGDYRANCSSDYRADYSKDIRDNSNTAEPTVERSTLPSITSPPEGISCHQQKPDDDQMTAEDFKNKWNVFAQRNGLTPIRKLTTERRNKLRMRLASDTWLDEFREACKKMPLQGTNWQPDFDWFVRNDTNANAIIEGKYDWLKKTVKNADTTDDQGNISVEQLKLAGTGRRRG